MARPKTEAANYIALTLRLPPDLLAEVRRRTEQSGMPINTALIRLLRERLDAEEDMHTAERTRRTAASS